MMQVVGTGREGCLEAESSKQIYLVEITGNGGVVQRQPRVRQVQGTNKKASTETVRFANFLFFFSYVLPCLDGRLSVPAIVGSSFLAMLR